MNYLLIIFFGLLFGGIIQYARLNKYNVISGLAIRENFTVAKAIALAIGVGMLVLSIEMSLGLAGYHVKPLIVGGIILGGILFGSGMAILGYCPGTLAISFGQGSLDAVAGIAGGLTAGIIYTLVLPFIKPIMGPNLGALSLHSVIGTNAVYYILLVITAAIFIAGAFWLHKKDKNKEVKWIISGTLLGLLNNVVFLKITSNRPIGASTSYPYLSDVVFGATHNDYFNKIKTPGHWELIFLGGAFLAGLIFSLIKKDFKFSILHTNWKKHKNSSKKSRLLWAFTGGFLLLFGARMAGGCTSGHILSGGMQLAFSSLIFAVFVFGSLLITGKLFYKK